MSYTEEEEKLLHRIEDINLTKYILTSKGKKKKGEVIRARKGLGNNKKKTDRFDKAVGYVRIVSAPFGGMNKR